MKKYFALLTMAAVALTSFTSCDKKDDDDDPIVVPASKIKTISVNYGDGVEGYEFIYDANDKISKIYNSWEGEVVDTITYDYSVSGKLTITKEDWPTTYELNSEGLVTKEIWDETSWASYTYTDGYLSSVVEHWDGADHKKYDVEITSGNVTKHTRYGDDGNVNRYKTFTYTTGDNKSEIQQANAVDSNWKTVGGIFGKASNKLVDYLEYWEPGDEANKGTTTITYTFDSENRVSTMTRSGDGWQEAFSFTYYAD
ncbi:MAG: hypothetical protein JNL22_10595 [Bacteroidales bacterium]|jgi:hypothetical protein|nr:hypothetical protein [Bacteroidales bacterium]